MVGKTTNFVMRRGDDLDFFDLTVTTSQPSGLRVRDYDQFIQMIRA